MGSKGNKRSGFEHRCGELLEGAGFFYEPFKVPYITTHLYTPDFSCGNVLVEVKGWFRPGDRQKYKAVRDSILNDDYELVFLLQSPGKKVQKGAQLTMGGWCDKEAIKWFSYDNIGELITYAMEKN